MDIKLCDVREGTWNFTQVEVGGVRRPRTHLSRWAGLADGVQRFSADASFFRFAPSPARGAEFRSRHRVRADGRDGHEPERRLVESFRAGALGSGPALSGRHSLCLRSAILIPPCSKCAMGQTSTLEDVRRDRYLAVGFDRREVSPATGRRK